MTFALRPDPWKHTSSYQQTKYQQTIELLGSIPITRVLELGCAEGHFTVQLAQRVGSLLAADISQIALERAKARCADHKLKNVGFLRLNMTSEPLPGCFELIVCSEVLYYISGQKALQAFARKLVDALAPGGYLLTAHANRVDREPDRTKFDWLLPFGARFIGETLANTYPLRLVKEIWTPCYGIQLFQNDGTGGMRSPLSLAEATDFAESTLPLPEQGILDLFSLAFLYNQLQRLRRNE